MNHYLLKRKYRIFILILFAGSIYLCFQIFSFKVLNFSTHKSLKFYGKHSGKLIQDFHQDEKEDTVEEQSVLENKENDFDKLKLVKNGNIHSLEIEKGKKEHVLGTYFMQTEDYTMRSDGKFVCLHSKEVIPFSAVNDDYCDCSDATDEPGTSACPDSKFYCTFQYKNAEPQHVPGSQVNDGVCDCCDGSDEWQNILVFPGVHLTEKRWKNGLSHAPCENKCAAVELANEEDAKIRHLGQRLKVTYIEAGRQSPKGDLYGPGGIFYKLSLSCYNMEDSEYKFTLCPFKSVTQQKFPQAAVNLGNSPVWKIKVHDIYVLKMEKGDHHGCPGGRFRSTVITFICGLSDKIVKVSEAEKCVYSMTFSTPAAC